MAVINAQTREQIRVAVGYNLGAVRVGTMTSNGTTSTGVDAELPNAVGVAGKHVVLTSGDNDGQIRTVDSYAGSTTTWTIRGDVLGTATADGDTYELWDEDMPPARVHNFIDRAVSTITRKGAPPVTNLALHGFRDRRIHAIPSAVVGIQHVSYRSGVTYKTIHNCNSIWDEQVNGATASLDTEDYVEGTGACKFASGPADDRIIASQDISSLDISKYDFVEFWVKANAAVAAASLELLLDNTALCASPVETLALPALVADTWTFVRIALASPEADTALISVALNQKLSIGAVTVWIDDIRAVVAGSARWQLLPRAYYSIDRDRRELVLTDVGRSAIGYSLIRLEGVKKPTQLTADGTSADVEGEYLIDLASSWAMYARMSRYAPAIEAATAQADRLTARAERWLSQQRMPSGVMWVDD